MTAVLRRLAAVLLAGAAPCTAAVLADAPGLGGDRASPVAARPSFSVAATAVSPLTTAALLPPAAVLSAPAAAPSALSVAPAATPLSPAPAAAPALRAVAAAAEGPSPAAPDPRALDSFWDGSLLPGRAANSFWDGFRSDEFPAPSGSAVHGAVLDDDDASEAPWLALKDKKYAAALEHAVALARSTNAGRRAFDLAQKALDARGETLPVVVRDLGRNWGEFDYLEGRMRLHKKLFEKGREAELAGTLAHELLHVAQHADGLPSNALELEIEAHLLDLELMEELGLAPTPHTFAAQAHAALKKSPAAFIELISAAVPGSPFLGGSGMADVIDQLEQDLDDAQARRGERAKGLAGVIAQDLASLRSKKGAAAYRAFSKRVLAELARRSAAAR